MAADTKTDVYSTIGIACISAALVICAVVNLFGNFRPVAGENERLANRLNQASALSFPERIQVYTDMRQEQEMLLAKNPIEPYAWMRLAYLRKVTQGNRRHAFEALKFADTISHPDNVGGLERILMWHDFADVQTDAEREHEKDMWRAGYRQNWYWFMGMVRSHHMMDELKAAVMEDPQLAARWNEKEKSKKEKSK